MGTKERLYIIQEPVKTYSHVNRDSWQIKSSTETLTHLVLGPDMKESEFNDLFLKCLSKHNMDYGWAIHELCQDHNFYTEKTPIVFNLENVLEDKK